MAESIIKNQATFTGCYGDSECPIEFSSNEVSTTIIKGLTATKTADKNCWVNGPLTYTITIKNETSEAVTGGIMIDTWDPAVIAFDDVYGIYINGMTTTQYTYAVGTLSVTLPTTIGAGEQVSISFRVTQV